MIWLICLSFKPIDESGSKEHYVYCNDYCTGTIIGTISYVYIQTYKCSIYFNSAYITDEIWEKAAEICPTNVSTPIPPATPWPPQTPREPDPPATPMPPQSLPPMPTAIPPKTPLDPATPEPAQTLWAAPTAYPGQTLPPMPTGIVLEIQAQKQSPLAYWLIGGLGFMVIIEGTLIGYAIWLTRKKPTIEPQTPQENSDQIIVVI